MKHHCPMCGEQWNDDKCGICGWYEPKALNAIVDTVLAYRPKAKSKPARRRKRRAEDLHRREGTMKRTRRPKRARHEEEAYQAMLARVRLLGGICRTAKVWRISPSYLSDVVARRRRMGDRVLRKIGWVRIEVLTKLSLLKLSKDKHIIDQLVSETRLPPQEENRYRYVVEEHV